jgi:hypothetical protein
VQFALGEPEPKVSAKLKQHTVHYRVSLPPGMTVTFAEQTRTLLHVVGVAKHAAGTLRFTPAVGAPGRRQLVAIIDDRGLPFKQQVIGTFTVPRPAKPGRPRRVRIKTSGRAFAVSFSTPPHASRVLVVVTTTDGRSIQRILPVTARKLSIPVLGYNDGVTVTVAGLSAVGQRGPAKSAHAKRKS